MFQVKNKTIWERIYIHTYTYVYIYRHAYIPHVHVCLNNEDMTYCQTLRKVLKIYNAWKKYMKT